MKERATTRFGHFVVRQRVPIALLLVLSTAFFPTRTAPSLRRG